MSTIHHILLADLAEQLRVALPVIFGVLYVIAQLVSAAKQEKKKRAKQPPREADVSDPLAPRPNLAGAPPAAEKPRGLEETLRKEVEEFLRRAQGKPEQAPGKRPTAATKPRSTPPQTPRQESAVEPPRRRLVESAQGSQIPTPGQPASSAGGTGRLRLPTGAAVDAYVTEQMRGVKTIGQQADALGDDVALADERMEAHLHSRFDHKLGTLMPEASVVSKQVSQANDATKEFRELLMRPGGMRQLIIANEILRRPEERW